MPLPPGPCPTDRAELGKYVCEPPRWTSDRASGGEPGSLDARAGAVPRERVQRFVGHSLTRCTLHAQRVQIWHALKAHRIHTCCRASTRASMPLASRNWPCVIGPSTCTRCSLACTACFTASKSTHAVRSAVPGSYNASRRALSQIQYRQRQGRATLDEEGRCH